MLAFFFQAEDGIRDADVTGVQTCALPIFESILEVFPKTIGSVCAAARIESLLNSTALISPVNTLLMEFKYCSLISRTRFRSEERRVGKECRSRSSSTDYKIK